LTCSTFEYIRTYAQKGKSGRVQEAKAIFDSLSKSDAYAYTSMS